MYNLSKLDTNNDGTPEETYEACGDLPYVTHDKTLASIVPVSYTHLRAHETVLDLVCRLLLEKKKQHTT